MTEDIKQRARELGFDDCHITTAEPPASAVQFEQWLQQGRHGEMAYLQRNASKRVQPEQVLPGAKSIIVLAASYFPDQRRPSEAPAQGTDVVSAAPARRDSKTAGVIARYACYQDYHDVLGGRLSRLAAFVGELGGAGTRSLWYVDTGPLLERDLAQRAGAGFIGKHTNLIGRHLGNWFFLSEILTTLALKPDPPEKNRCGSCTRCLSACPTQAIVAPFQLDARRCISYLTIELKGAIPIELRPAIGNRIFGCDDCLAACPWNRFAREGRLMRAHSRPDLNAPDLADLLSLDEPEFKRRFAGTPLLRAKRRGLLRNICVALGNLGDEKAMPALQKAAGDPEPLIAEHARWALERIRARSLRPEP